jgi:hypothetical protein
VRVPIVKGDLSLPKIEIKPKCLLDLSKWQKKKLREKSLVWAPKRSVQAQKDDVQASGATKAKERQRFKKQLPS